MRWAGGDPGWLVLIGDLGLCSHRRGLLGSVTRNGVCVRLMRKQLLAAVGGGSVLAGGWLVRRYRHDVAAARARQAAIDRTVIETSLTAGDGAAESRVG